MIVERKIIANDYLDVDEDDYIPEFDVVPDEAFVLPENLPTVSGFESDENQHENYLIDNTMQEGSLRLTHMEMQEGSSQLTQSNVVNVDLHGQATLQSENNAHFTKVFRKEFPEMMLEFDEHTATLLAATHTATLLDATHTAMLLDAMHTATLLAIMLAATHTATLLADTLLATMLDASHTTTEACMSWNVNRRMEQIAADASRIFDPGSHDHRVCISK